MQALAIVGYRVISVVGISMSLLSTSTLDHKTDSQPERIIWIVALVLIESALRWKLFPFLLNPSISWLQVRRSTMFVT